ncbi:UDP-N-acetylglucosamine 2-epimerase (non-hydrolyzing), partial [Candidatus Pacearchaeota archaeon]|nr:UDP-N-acetylglucosamine 2-epimerase (non-hydrolyzing) [Candidatus Pacearchaeota archaeon]
MPKPDIDLEVGSGSHSEQTGKVMVEFEKVCHKEKPDLIIVVGDVNSTMACSITAKKLNIKVAHVEAGLRSRDMTMPEEINRLCTDVISDYLFTTDHFANENLRQEGIPDDKVVFVGNVMIDTLIRHQTTAMELATFEKFGLRQNGYATLTLHRPSNVDDPEIFEGLLQALTIIAERIPIIFAIHPRTRKMAKHFGLSHYFNQSEDVQGLWVTEPIGYLDFLNLNMHASMLLTDSGGLQEEATVLGVPCLTLRPNTERPITCEVGTNIMVGNDKDKLLHEADRVLKGKVQVGRIPDKWDGKAAERIVDFLLSSWIA